jgi:ABC-type Fe3+-siderophore transport system permease subunit
VREQRFVAIGEELLRAGLAPRRVRRMLFELESHMDDLVQELEGQGSSREEAEAEALRRLHAEAIVEAARERTELHSKMQRWPAAAFTLLPLFVYAALFAGSLALLVIGLSVAKSLGFPVEGSVILQQIATSTTTGLVLILPASVAITFCILASSRRVPLSWTLAGVALVSLLGATTNAQLELPPKVTSPALGAGLTFSTESVGMPLLRAVCTFLVVMLLYLWHTRTQRRAA